MNVRQRKRLIALAAALVGLAAAGVLVAGFLVPVTVPVHEVAPASDGPDVAPNPNGDQAPARDGSLPALPALPTLQRLCGRNLRRPLYDPPPVARAAAPKPAMTVQFIGTVIEPGQSVAMFRKSDGSIAWCAPGESVEDAGSEVRVTSVEYDKVTVQFAGESRELVIAPETPPGGTP